MVISLTKDQIYTHSVLNFMSACYQGKFAELNILSQLNYPAFSRSSVEIIKTDIVMAKERLSEFYQGRFLLDSTGRRQPADFIDVKQKLKIIQEELRSLAQEIDALLVAEQSEHENETLCLLISAFGRVAYSRDNYMRGYIKYGKTIEDEVLVERYTIGLDNCTLQINTVSDLVINLKQPHKPDYKFSDFVKFNCRSSAGVLRAQAHDAVQYMQGPDHQMSYSEAGIPETEIELWKNENLAPILAGYWYAYEFHPEEVLTWLSLQIEDPLIASTWITAGFPPHFAILWIEAGFSPFMAIQWHNVGFAPDIAVELVKKGYNFPEQIPEELLASLMGTSPLGRPIGKPIGNHPTDAPAPPASETGIPAGIPIGNAQSDPPPQLMASPEINPEESYAQKVASKPAPAKAATDNYSPQESPGSFNPLSSGPMPEAPAERPLSPPEEKEDVAPPKSFNPLTGSLDSDD